jgi:tRNA threonylcarbamoyladenosine biosynthesis protein TsaB
MLQAQNWQPSSIEVVLFSRGPGSYTGLRVGIISAKMLAYATGARVVAVDTLEVIALQAGDRLPVEVVADAQQGNIYVQLFTRGNTPDIVRPASELTIRNVDDWLAARDASTWVSGPGLFRYSERLSAGARRIPAHEWEPRTETLLAVGMRRIELDQFDDPWTVEPLYLRPSSAEKKWEQLQVERAPKEG